MVLEVLAARHESLVNVLRTFGEHIFNRYVEIKRQEWECRRRARTFEMSERPTAATLDRVVNGRRGRRLQRWSELERS